MNQTKLTCTRNENEATADILEKNSRRLRVVMVETNITIELFKQTPHDTYYIGYMSGLEFTSTGEEI